MSRLLAPLISLLACQAAAAQGLADLTLEPAASAAFVGDVVEVILVASAQGATPADMGALDALLVYDPAVLQLLSSDESGAGYSWFLAGFLSDPDNINADVGDGDALFTALSQITLAATAPAPPGLHVTTLRFQALAPSSGTQIGLATSLGAFGRTQVLDFFTPGLDITGDISSVANVMVSAAPVGYCGGTIAACPCSNDAGPGQGCRNSTGVGATLQATGSTSLTADDLVLTSSDLPLFQSGVIYMGPNQIQLPFGDGLRCVGGGSLGVVRFPVTNSGAGGMIALGPGFGASTPITPGATWNFQSWYRDPTGPCGNAFNLSSAIAVTFLP